jgi:catechol 2,3-dioxygenase-like lactoylglutathione lyase family enzyme
MEAEPEGINMIIQEIKLLAKRLEPLIDFYRRVLELPVLEQSASHVSFGIGLSRLTFERSDDLATPYYHFAFNMTESKADLAIPWLKAKGIRINLINGEEDCYSKTWNSHSVYFYDPAGNIVEFIARHNLKQESDQREFLPEDLLNISEIGIPADDVIELSNAIIDRLNEQVYLAGDSMFTPIGDEQGLLILSSLDRNWLGSDKKVRIFPLEIVLGNGANDPLQLDRYPYRITSRSEPG